MVRKPVVHAEPGKPADRQVDLRLAHQPAIMDNAEQKPGQHEAHRRLRINGGTTEARRVGLRHLLVQPAQNDTDQRSNDLTVEMFRRLPHAD